MYKCHHMYAEKYIYSNGLIYKKCIYIYVINEIKTKLFVLFSGSSPCDSPCGVQPFKRVCSEADVSPSNFTKRNR